MASVQTLARPYARAAFELARDASALSDWSDKLGFAATLSAAPGMRELIANPTLNSTDLGRLVLPEQEPADGEFARFIHVLAEKQRLPALTEIAAQFEQLKREHERVLRVIAHTAVALEATQADALKAALKRRFQREIVLENRIDPGVLGGAVIDAEGVVIDGSVRGRLQALDQAVLQ
ncbi:MAG: F0F1 ATP synthase subunit delta [Bradyrhizobium sp.]|uniref:F0F1 ATP synthase subunit delta n=1 Tax=Bradyrhizobium sp. TaxID=376 RepID=UPI003D13C726